METTRPQKMTLFVKIVVMALNAGKIKEYDIHVTWL